MVAETLVSDLLNASAAASGSGGLDGIIEIVLALLGIGGTTGAGALVLQIKSLVSFFDSDNDDANTAPGILKLFTNVRTWTMSDATLAKIKAAVPASELQAVINAIEAAQTARKAAYDIESSIGTIHIEYGEVTNPEILTATTKTTTASEDTTVKKVTQSADGKLIGTAKLVSIISEKTSIVSGVTLDQDDYVGKELDITLKGTSIGWVIGGVIWDGTVLEKGEFYVQKAGSTEVMTAKSFRFPQHKKSDVDNGAPLFSVGEHTLEIAFGYYAGHDDIQGDITVWTERSDPIKITVTE